MKKAHIFIILFITFLSNAQNPIIDLSESRLGKPDGYYKKDIHNLLNPFEGTYLYTNGNTLFKVILVKKVQQYNGRYYEDLIIGEYQYIVNGIERVNTINEINTVYNNQRVHNIDGNIIVDNNFRMWKCPTCPVNEKRLSGSIRDASTDRYANFTMRRTNENGQEVLKIYIYGVSRAENENDPNFSLPLLNELTLIKQ
ncbi:DUF6705 family protein [Flavobacterium proteolyticum]|uniref:DUF6705 domain-containing protein n=1 Tax=Flavobacterium proteolyticum TaxID=2911683 RepID=A0ABR9WN86_9FLAO|nr:DUF6705 family protein [Flavobacterium proteolyticum]MBE9575374.1 hypothetical protein [Flavobacterium proteolyticum]